MNVLAKLKARFHSPVVVVSTAALIALVAKEWLGFTIPGWDAIIQAFVVALTAFGVFNNPDNKDEF